MFTLSDHNENTDYFPWRGEPIFRNGKYAGSVTSTSYGYTLNSIVCLGFIKHEEPDTAISLPYITDKSAKYEISIGNKRYAAKVYAYPPKIEAANLGFYLPSQKMLLNS